MNNIGSNLNAYRGRYSQQTIEDGKFFYNSVKKINKDYYKKQEEIANGTNIFLKFLKKVRLDALRQFPERCNVFVQPKSKHSVNLTLDSDAPSSTQPQQSLQQQKNNTIAVTKRPLYIKENRIKNFRLNKSLNGGQIQYLNNVSKEYLEELNKETPQIVVSEHENRHIVSEKELKALVHIVFCQKFGIKNENTKELERRVIDFDNNQDGKKININTAQNYYKIINTFVNKHVGNLYEIQGSSLCKSKLIKINKFVVDKLSELDKLKNINSKE